MTLTPHRLRLMAIPVLLCASWFFDGGRLIASFIVEQSEQSMKPPIKTSDTQNDGATVPPPHLEQPSSLFQNDVHDAAEQALRGSVSVVQDNDDKKIWYEQNTAVQTLNDALSKSLTQEEKLHWYEEPVFHPSEPQIDCPSPKKFQGPVTEVTELEDFTDQQKNDLKRQLENGFTTIRNAFLPWIDKGGFHPDLILHGGKVAGLYVGIFDGKLFLGGKQHSSAKVRLLAEHLESVMEEFHKQGVDIPDVIFPYTVRSIPPDSLTRACARHSAVPPHLQDYYDTVPVAGIAMDPSLHTGVALMPNMYFGNLRVWDRYTRQLLDGGKVDTPWNKRHKRVFWRGKIDKRLEHNAPRLEALQAAARDTKTSPRRLDIALTSGCDYLKEFASNVTRTSPLAPKWLPKDYFIKVTECGGSNRMLHAKYTNYWAQLNLPGSSLGSYSKNLQNLWPTGAAVMIWNQSAVEFYYDTLKTGVTHVWVNETTIEPMAEKLFSNKGKLAQLMGNVGREWFAQHLTSQAILDYYKQWFYAWAGLQRFTPSPDMLPDPCTCAGWVDADKKKHDGVKRCPYCVSYPRSVRKGCLEMMGHQSDPSLCK